jgi:hypothetical protein
VRVPGGLGELRWIGALDVRRTGLRERNQREKSEKNRELGCHRRLPRP